MYIYIYIYSNTSIDNNHYYCAHAPQVRFWKPILGGLSEAYKQGRIKKQKI